jgi:hypothetical protein
MNRRNALIVTGVLALGLWIYLASVDREISDTGGPGIVPYEFAWDQERAEEIHAEWGDEGRDLARKSLWVDYAFMLAYGAFFVLASAATRDLARDRGWRRLAALGVYAVPLAVAAPIFDALENAGLLLTLDGNGGDAAPLLAGIFASLKFATLIAAQLYVIAGLVQRFRDRRGTAQAV